MMLLFFTHLRSLNVCLAREQVALVIGCADALHGCVVHSDEIRDWVVEMDEFGPDFVQMGSQLPDFVQMNRPMGANVRIVCGRDWMLRLSAEQDGREQTGRRGQMAGLRDENEREREDRGKQRRTEENAKIWVNTGEDTSEHKRYKRT